MKISDLIFSKYVGNSLPQAKMVEVEKQLIEDGEALIAVQASIAEYELNIDRARDLLGDAEDITTDIEINTLNKDRNESTPSSIVVNKQLTTKNKIKMSMNLSKEEALRIQELVTSFNESYDETVTLDENLSKFLINNCPGTFPEDAADAIKGLRSGIEQFNVNLQRSLSEQGFDYADELRNLSVEMPMEQRYEIYLNFLAAITTLSKENMADGETFQIENYQEIKERLRPAGEVTEEMLIDVEQRIAEVLNNNTVCLGNLDALRQLVASLPEGAEAIESAITGSDEDVKQKLILSMATYISIMQGGVESVKIDDVTPEMVAMSTSMGVEQTHVINDLQAGRTTADRAIKILKILGGVLLFSLLAFAFVLFSLDFFDFTIEWMKLLLGASLIANLVSLAISIIIFFKMSGSMSELINDTLEASSKLFDDTVALWRNQVWPSIKATIANIVSWFSERRFNGSIVEQNQDNEDIAPTINANA